MPVEKVSGRAIPLHKKPNEIAVDAKFFQENGNLCGFITVLNTGQKTQLLMFKLFGKKKKEFRAACELSKEPLEKGRGYVITTAQLIASKKFWDNKMTEPETLSYTQSHFKSGDSTSTNMRQMIFNKYGNVDKPWIISESYGHLFDVDLDKAQTQAKEWWEKEGNFIPEGTDASLKNLDTSSFEEYKDYAVMEAGRSRVAV